MRTTRITRLGLGLIAGALALTACAPGPSNGGDDATTGGDTAGVEPSTEIGSDPIELVLYDGAGLKTIDDQLIAAFIAKYPNVSITTRFDPDNVQAQNAPRILSAGDPPDIARVTPGATVSADLLTNLDAWAELYGWTDLPVGQLANYTVNDEGVRGSGSQFSLASGFVTTGLYVNTDKMAELGIDAPPTTVEEWSEQMATAKAAGEVPMILGNATGQAVFPLQYLLNGHLGQQAINDWVFNVPGATIATPEGDEAVKTMAGWVEAGYFNDDANGTEPPNALARFVAGEGLFFPSGNWDAKSIGDQMSGVTFVSPPALNAGELKAQSNPVSNFAIPAKAKAENKNAAAAFLNFMLSDEARQIAVDNGFAPSGSGTPPNTEAGSLNEAVQTAFAALVEADGQVQFMQDATAGIKATEDAAIQNLFGGRLAPEEFLPQVQAAYEEELGR